MEERVILVDPQDNEVGTEEKLRAHRLGLLHRAFSVFIFNSKGQLMLQKRAFAKYHSAGLWANTCCSHPRAGEKLEDAAHRKLKAEMGFDCDLEEIFRFLYKVELESNLFEHEIDHVFAGRFDGQPSPNSEEVADWKWVDLADLIRDVKRAPEEYAYWFKICLQHPAIAALK